MRIFLTITLIASIAAPVAIDNPACAQETGLTPAESERVRVLVSQLSAPDFSARQAAANELLKLSPNALPALRAALASATGESEVRLRQIVDQLMLRLFDEQLAAWTDTPAESPAAAPDIERYFQLIQEDDRTRRVLVEVLKAERRLFALRQFAPDDLSAELETRSAEFSRQCHGRDDEPFPIASALGLMLLASDADVRLLRATSTNISDALDDPRFEQLLEEGAFADVITAVTSAWMKRPGISAERPLIFCMRHELPAGVDIAKRVIESQSRRQDMAWSLLCLASLNDTNSLPLVESLLETPAQLWPPRGQAVQDLLPDREIKSTYAVQTRDVALAVAIHLRGRTPGDFGFDADSSELTVFALESLGFDTDDERLAAIAEYRRQFSSSPKP